MERASSTTSTCTYELSARSFGKESTGTITIRHLSPKDRTTRLVKTFAIGFGCTALSVLIPVAHFVLVPLGIVLTPLVALYSYSVKALVVSGSGVCPVCDAPFSLRQAKATESFSETCSQCNRPIELRWTH